MEGNEQKTEDVKVKEVVRNSANKRDICYSRNENKREKTSVWNKAMQRI